MAAKGEGGLGSPHGNTLVPSPLCGGNTPRKCKGELGFRALAMFCFHMVTKCYPVLLFSEEIRPGSKRVWDRCRHGPKGAWHNGA